LLKLHCPFYISCFFLRNEKEIGKIKYFLTSRRQQVMIKESLLEVGMFGRKKKKECCCSSEGCGWPANVSKGKETKTRVVVCAPAGSKEPIFLRGDAAGLSWSKGIQLDHVSGNEWIWETHEPLGRMEFKVLLNDKVWEEGNNHVVEGGKTVEYTAKFPQ
jgi:hypothetical protein